ncbi:MAG: hypothetical protein Q8916_05565 [Bacteroidota bacterium]|nr:hypothetical protein [Bacteroidota bacterium]MDP4229858.1 hypothetical protein [Bacteroidota bacterium]MDP4234967.1 hypothetical protein [Bacteroidota bacterium]
MRQFISSEKKYANICNLFLGHSLIAIMMYILYRIGSFLIDYLPADILNIILAVAGITVTMFATRMLLRLDAKSSIKAIPIRNREYDLQKDRA